MGPASSPYDTRLASNRNDFVGMPHPGCRTRAASRIAIALLLILLTALSFITAIPFHPAVSTLQNPANDASSSTSSQQPQTVGADGVPNLRLPKTILSHVDSLTGPGVIQTSADNLTLYNPGVKLRLIGGTVAHDELLGPGMNVLSSYLSWEAETNSTGLWRPIIAVSSKLTMLGSNVTGAYVMRTMNLAPPMSGVLKIIYVATAKGSIKYNLVFSPATQGFYRLTYRWRDTPGVNRLSALSKRFDASYNFANYTLSWDDIPPSLNSTASLSPGLFQLHVNLGSLAPGSSVGFDPQIISQDAVPSATSYSFQRKVFYEPKGGYYFAFYYNGSYTTTYAYSHDGSTWSLGQMPTGWPAYFDAPTSSVSVYNIGQTVAIAVGQTITQTFNCSSAPCRNPLAVSLYYALGTINGPTISWLTNLSDQVFTPVTLTRYCDNNALSCTLTASIRYVSVTQISTGLAFSFNYYANGPVIPNNDDGVCKWDSNVESDVGVRFALNQGGFFDCETNSLPMRSIPLAADSNGGLRLVYQNYTSSSNLLKTAVVASAGQGYNCCIGWRDTTLTPNEDLTGNFSAAIDANYGTHVVFQDRTDGNVSYAYLPQGGSWAFTNSIFGPCIGHLCAQRDDPTITVDFSTNDLYVFGRAATSSNSSIGMLHKGLAQEWSESSYQTIEICNNPAQLGSNIESISGTNSSWLSLIWTCMCQGNPVYFESLPIQTAWSPFASPSDPWDGYGVAPYGQYFTNLGESVSTSTGLLTIRQNLLSIPGRGLNLDVSLVYSEPQGFLSLANNGSAYNFEPYPYVATMKGWRLDFPWMTLTQSGAPTSSRIIHLWNGEGYNIPPSFWNGNAGTFENHQGENFRMVRNTTAIFLYSKAGVAYVFDISAHTLSQIIDPSSNKIAFNYDSQNRISVITDTVGRTLLFCYNSSNDLTRIDQASGNCAAETSLARSISLSYGTNYLTITDPAARPTTFLYGGASDSYVSQWLISQITYPTGWYTSYSYVPSRIGTDVLTYRVSSQVVRSNPSSVVKFYVYNYNTAPGGSVIGSSINIYNGTTPMGAIIYSFSFAGVAWNTTDTTGKLLGGELQLFGVGGQVVKDTRLVVGSTGLSGSYTSYFQYDLWGNMIYSRRSINPASNWYHESFNSYYNDGLPPSFNAFQETFSNNGAGFDNRWLFIGGPGGTWGSWMVHNGALNASLSGQPTSAVSNDIGVGSISMQASIYINKLDSCNSATPQFGIFAHSGWSLTLTYSQGSCPNSPVLYLSNVNPLVSSACPIQTGKWYTFNLTIQGLQATGWAGVNGQPACPTVSFAFSSHDPYATKTGFGLTASYSSLLYRNITVTTVFPLSGEPGFTKSFIGGGAPGTNVHGALAGSAEFQNGTGTQSIESYNSYVPWGGLNQTRHLYNSTSGAIWLTTSRKYDVYGNLISITDPRGNSTSYGYSLSYPNYPNSQSTFLTSINQTLAPSGTLVLRRYSYNFTIGTLTSSVDPNGYNTTYQYDVLGRPTRINYPSSLGFDAYTYNDTANYVIVTNENGWKTIQIYDGLARLSRIDRFLNGVSYSNQTYTYNWQDKVTTLTDARGNVTTYQYDLIGRTTKIIEPILTTTQTVYNTLNSTILSIDEQGNNACKVYDRLNRLLSVIEYSNSTCGRVALNGQYYVTNYYYDEIGDLRKLTTSNSQTTTYTYDSVNRLAQTSHPDSTRESYTYDNNGNLVNLIDQNGNRTSRSYDSLNRIVNITYYGKTTSLDNYKYDANGNLLQLQSQNATLGYTYDGRNRVLCETYAVNGYSTIGGPCGNSGGGGSVAAGTLITLPDETVVPVQNLKQGMQLQSYNVTTSQFTTSTITRMVVVNTTDMLIINTADGRDLRTDNATIQRLWVKQEGGTIGWLSVTQLRTGDSLFVPQTQTWTTVTSMKDIPGHFVMYDIYDTAPGDYVANGYLDPIKAPTRGPLGPNGGYGTGYSFQYSYNRETLASITYNDNLVVSYYYDGLGRVSSLSFSASLPASTSFTYYPNDELKGIQYGNGLVDNYTYDKNSRPLQLKLTNGTITSLLLNYHYYNTGTVSSLTGQSKTTTGSTSTISESYTYDPLARLANSTTTTGGTATNLWYMYDTVGNRIAQGLNGTATHNAWVKTTYGYNTLKNELLTTTSSGATSNYGYDLNGNLVGNNVSSTRWTYIWNVQGQMLKVSNSSNAQGYNAYDGLGRRIESKASTSYLFYGYLGTETLADLSNTGASNDYVYADGLRIARITGYSGSNPTTVYYHTDALGSTRLVTSSTKSVVFSDSYQPYGQDNSVSGSETYKFAGKPVSQTTGLYYEYQRWYDASTGRFLSQDSLAGFVSLPQSLNRYVYVSNTPTSLVDPSGMTEEGEGFHCAEDQSCGASPEASLVAGEDPVVRAELSNNLHGDWSSALRGETFETFSNPLEATTVGPLAEPARVNLSETSAETATTGDAPTNIDLTITPDSGSDSAGSKHVVVGENMDRVSSVADKYGYQTIPRFSEGLTKQQRLLLNRAWINEVMNKGYIVVDIGPAKYYPNYPYISSEYYAVEEAELAGRNYSRWVQMWGVED